MTASGLGRTLVAFGLVIAVCGALLWVFGTLPRLPGDISVQRRGVTLYVPVLGSLLLSLLLTLVLNLFFARR